MCALMYALFARKMPFIYGSVIWLRHSSTSSLNWSSLLGGFSCSFLLNWCLDIPHAVSMQLKLEL